ncbi:hypothetical protein BJV78DRAFT_581018 [Lactifluus subvellereus]|nr:hypothetical protein BJV78DRAFT_581018 [Lactifluus subvellereus]
MHIMASVISQGKGALDIAGMLLVPLATLEKQDILHCSAGVTYHNLTARPAPGRLHHAVAARVDCRCSRTHGPALIRVPIPSPAGAILHFAAPVTRLPLPRRPWRPHCHRPQVQGPGLHFFLLADVPRAGEQHLAPCARPGASAPRGAPGARDTPRSDHVTALGAHDPPWLACHGPTLGHSRVDRGCVLDGAGAETTYPGGRRRLLTRTPSRTTSWQIILTAGAVL